MHSINMQATKPVRSLSELCVSDLDDLALAHLFIHVLLMSSLHDLRRNSQMEGHVEEKMTAAMSSSEVKYMLHFVDMRAKGFYKWVT